MGFNSGFKGLNVRHNVICALHNVDTLYCCKTGLHKAVQGSENI